MNWWHVAHKNVGTKEKNHSQPDNFTKYEIIITNYTTIHSQPVEKCK